MANIEIIVGTNEEFVLGYKLTEQEDGKVSLCRTFADHAHTGSVRQVAVSGKFLVSGATDEILKIFNLHTRTEVGTIMEHQGTISSLVFHTSKYLFSAADDGNICVFNRKNWECEKTLKGHTKGVTGLAVHPSGKLALSVGHDMKLRTWNLIKGRKAFITNLKTVADSVYWSPDGTHYLVVKGSCVDVYKVDMGQVVHSVDFKEKVYSLIFLTDDIIAVGGEGKNICLYDITTKLELTQWTAHTLRVKSIRVIPREAAEDLWLVSASSDGTIKVWSLELLSLSSKPKLLGEVDTTCRIICMDIYLPPQPALKTEALLADEPAASDDSEAQDVQVVPEIKKASSTKAVQKKRKKQVKILSAEETNTDVLHLKVKKKKNK